ncbi:MAG: P63C domain-containing protein [Gammaproteobacteria bacterium]
MSKKIDAKKLSEQLKKLQEDEALRQSLLFRSDSLIENKFSDRNLDKENERIELIGGVGISIKLIRETIAGRLNKYPAPFKQEWYDLIFKLNRNSNDVDPSHQWSAENAAKFIKPSEVADYTNEIIYGRFPEGILPVLQNLNPYIGLNIRAHKNYQFLTEGGYQQVKDFIEQSLNMMKTCTNWYEFRVKYNRKYGVPYQIDVFEENKYSF